VQDEPSVQVWPFTVVAGLARYVLAIAVPFHTPVVIVPMETSELSVVTLDLTYDAAAVPPKLVALSVPDPDTVRLAPLPITIAARLFVPPVSPENAAAPAFAGPQLVPSKLRI
jgi:hypothetical protein